MNLILLEAAEVALDGAAVLTGPRAQHLREVLRVEQDRQVRVGLVDGPVGAATVVDAHDGDRVRLRCHFEAATPPRPAVDLVLALPRPKVLRRLWAQLSALGLGRIVLTNAERVERPYFDTHVLSPEVYRPLLIEGLQQVRDTRVPVVTVHRRFRVLVEDELDGLAGASMRLLAHVGGPQIRVSEALADRATPRVLLAVGPEGGWNNFEVRLLVAHGFRTVDMGARTLRTDTACIGLLSLVHDELRRQSDSARCE